MSGPALLDVNMLVALFDQDHVHHETAHDWFADHQTAGWATCPITATGFVRVLANPAYPNGSTPVADLLGRLARLCASEHHQFWPADVSLLDDRVFDRALVHGHAQLTDIYLLGLARQHGGQLATFDRRIPLAAVKGAGRDTVAVLSPA